MKKLAFTLFVLCFLPVTAQNDTPNFREDQLYLSVAYPYFSNPPETLIQNKLSHAFSAGFVRDMPINKRRTWALGLGLGWHMAKWYTNTQFSVFENTISATAIADGYQQNFLLMQSIAVPLELRWRNATATKHDFWRIHTGIRLHVPLHLTSVYTSVSGFQKRETLPTNRTFLQWNLDFGFNTWNISIAHDMQPWAVYDTSLGVFDMKSTKIGLIFYIF